jgi:hypothetical protein
VLLVKDCTVSVVLLVEDCTVSVVLLVEDCTVSVVLLVEDCNHFVWGPTNYVLNLNDLLTNMYT